MGRRVQQGRARGLCWLMCSQVKNARGEWITAAPVPGTFVCNVGDMLRVYSNGEAFPPALFGSAYACTACMQPSTGQKLYAAMGSYITCCK